VIGDYNYVFDPDGALKRFFADGRKGEYVFLVDEAHNFVDRAREMYSAHLYKGDIIEARRRILPYHKPLAMVLMSLDRYMGSLMDEGETVMLTNVDEAEKQLTRAMGYMEELFDDERYVFLWESLMDFYFEVRHFLNMTELLDENYVIHTLTDEDGRFSLNLFCVNPSVNIKHRMETGIAGIMFSATLLPLAYYVDLLTGDRGDYAVCAPSPFDRSRRGLFAATDVSSRYVRRGMAEYIRIAEYIYRTVLLKKGKYMAFFPSYQFMEEICRIFEEKYLQEDTGVRLVIQSRNMTERDKADFLSEFYDNSVIDHEVSCLLGFCVLGGVFSEGIDLTEDSLIGVIVVGTGLPKVGPQTEILRKYFDDQGRGGFDYAYRIPGMNKVLQAAGRVIRTVNDRGIILLLDDRFGQRENKALFPGEWDDMIYGDRDTLLAQISKFWDNLKDTV